MNMKMLSRMVEERFPGARFEWELGKEYVAVNVDTGEVLAIYRPKAGTLWIAEKPK